MLWKWTIKENNIRGLLEIKNSTITKNFIDESEDKVQEICWKQVKHEQMSNEKAKTWGLEIPTSRDNIWLEGAPEKEEAEKNLFKKVSRTIRISLKIESAYKYAAQQTKTGTLLRSVSHWG